MVLVRILKPIRQLTFPKFSSTLLIGSVAAGDGANHDYVFIQGLVRTYLSNNA